MTRTDDTNPDTRGARRERVNRTTAESAITAAAVKISGGGDLEAALRVLYERALEDGRLQGQQAIEAARVDAAEARERATRYASDLMDIRGAAHRLSQDGVVIPEELRAKIWPEKVG